MRTVKQTSRSCNCDNEEEYFMLSHLMTSPPVRFQTGTEAPDGSTLPSAGKDRKPCILQLHKSEVSGCAIAVFASWLGNRPVKSKMLLIV